MPQPTSLRSARRSMRRTLVMVSRAIRRRRRGQMISISVGLTTKTVGRNQSQTQAEMNSTKSAGSTKTLWRVSAATKKGTGSSSRIAVRTRITGDIGARRNRVTMPRPAIPERSGAGIRHELGCLDAGERARLVLVRDVARDPHGAQYRARGVADEHAPRRRNHAPFRHGIERAEERHLL